MSNISISSEYAQQSQYEYKYSHKLKALGSEFSAKLVVLAVFTAIQLAVLYLAAPKGLSGLIQLYLAISPLLWIGVVLRSSDVKKSYQNKSFNNLILGVLAVLTIIAYFVMLLSSISFFIPDLPTSFNVVVSLGSVALAAKITHMFATTLHQALKFECDILNTFGSAHHILTSN